MNNFRLNNSNLHLSCHCNTKSCIIIAYWVQYVVCVYLVKVRSLKFTGLIMLQWDYHRYYLHGLINIYYAANYLIIYVKLIPWSLNFDFLLIILANHSCADFMFCLHSNPTHAIVVAGVLHCVWSEAPPQGNTLQYYSWPCGHTVFIKLCTSTAFVWYLLHTVIPPLHNISAILTCSS